MAMAKTKAELLLHIFFLPHLAPSHIISLFDFAKLFARCPGVRATIITTPGNAFYFHRAIDEATRSGHSMDLLLIPFPSTEVGLPDGCENTVNCENTITNLTKFFHALNLLKHPFEQLLRDHRPDCVVSDTVYSWTSDLGVPRIVFEASSPFCLCIGGRIAEAVLSGAVAADEDSDEALVLPGEGLPHPIEVTWSELPLTYRNPMVLRMFQEAEQKCYGVVVNSFYELLPEYVDHYSNKMLGGGRRKVWCLGPVWMCNKTDLDKAERGSGSGSYIDGTWERTRSWLDSQDRESVAYVCFGSGCSILSHDQLREIALGLESSCHPFIWVLPKDDASWLPEGFEERLGEKCLIVRGWAPQLQILNHPSVGGFVTHCGWNSTVEGVSTGVPMIAWPLQWEQFLNERMIVQVLGIGVPALEGVARTVNVEKATVVNREAVSRAVSRLMGDGEEAKAKRKRAKEYKEMATSAMEEGGSSHANLTRLIEELTVLAREKKKM